MQIEPRYRTADLRASRQQLGYSSCACCDTARLVRAPGDVAMCTCGEWYTMRPSGEVLWISAALAADLAREPMPAYEVLDALERGAAELARFTA